MAVGGSAKRGRALWLLLPALLLVLAIPALLWKGDSPTPDPVQLGAGTREPTPAGGGAPPPPVAGKRMPIVDRPPVTVEPGKWSVPLNLPVKPQTLRVRGTVVVVDEVGKEHRKESGELKLALMRGDSGPVRTVTVRQGSFAVDVPRKCRLRVSDAVLGGRVAYIADKEIPLSRTVKVVAKWVGPTVLRVLDSESGVDLVNLTLVETGGLFDIHPGLIDRQRVRLEGGRSPLALSHDPENGNVYEGVEGLWVGAPGYAWKQVTIHYVLGDEHRVELVPGGGLEVLVEGALPRADSPAGSQVADPAKGYRLRLRRPRSTPDLETRVEAAMAFFEQTTDEELKGRARPTKAQIRKMLVAEAAKNKLGDKVMECAVQVGKPLLFSGVLPGDYLVTVEIGDYSESSLVLGMSPVTVVAGRTVTTTVQIKSPVVRQTVPLAGTFYLPMEWEMVCSKLSLEPLDQEGRSSADRRSPMLIPAPSRPGLYRWNAGQVLPGRYEVRCHGLCMQWVVDTGPGGNRQAEIVVGDPVLVSVKIIDEVSGSPVEVNKFLWTSRRPQGVSGGPLKEARWCPDTRTYEFRAAKGHVCFQASSQVHSIVGASEFAVNPPRTELVLRVQSVCGVALTLKHGDKVIPWEGMTCFHLRIVKADGRSAGWQQISSRNHEAWLTVRKPGTYRITIPDQSGFETVPPLEIYIPAGEIVKRTIQLQRRI